MNICFKLATWQHKGNKKTGTIYLCYLCYLCYLYVYTRIGIYRTIYSILNSLNNIHMISLYVSVFSEKSGNYGNTKKNQIGLRTVYVTLVCSLLPKLQKISRLITVIKNRKWQHGD